MRDIALLLIALVAHLILSCNVRAQSDDRFEVSVAKATDAHVMLGDLALRISTDEPTRAFARRLVDDSKRNNGELAISANASSIELPASAAAPKGAVDEDLSALRGAEFDARFAKLVGESTAALLRTFTTASESVGDARLKSFATANLQVLQALLAAAKALGAETVSDPL
ncbi:MAG: DUF4142 domain-containing protein [Dokdonella sp.]